MAREKDEQSVDVNQLLQILQQQSATMAEQVARTAPKENPNYVAQSPFLKPDGEPWTADLRCDIFFGPIRLNRTVMTEAEVRAWNQVQPVEKAILTKLDGSTVRVTVRAREDAVGRVDRLSVELPLRRDDNPMHYPSLVEMARQLASQAAVAA